MYEKIEIWVTEMSIFFSQPTNSKVQTTDGPTNQSNIRCDRPRNQRMITTDQKMKINIKPTNQPMIQILGVANHEPTSQPSSQPINR